VAIESADVAAEVDGDVADVAAEVVADDTAAEA
jgi:hypothetical protein